MPHTPLLSRVARGLRIAEWCHDEGLRPADALRRAADADTRAAEISRRRFLAVAGATAATAALGRFALAGPIRGTPRIAIVGAGLAGLVCADALRAAGLGATIYEATSRVGGRCFSLRGFFPGQVAERGGEFIDTTHQTMRQYATEFGLLRDDVSKAEGDVLYDFGGRTFTDEQVVEEYRLLVPRIRADLQTLSGEPTFFANTAGDRALDRLSLADWLATRAGDLPLVRAALDEAYVAEYGLETREQSSLNFLLFIHADRRRRFTPFGVFSDERFHVSGGNDAIASAIAARLPGPIEHGRLLTRLARNVRGEFELTFASGPGAVADFVVMAIPFTVLRSVDLDASLGLSADKLRAIRDLGYGDNAKTMIGFQGRPWAAIGGNGAFYSDRRDVQTTWETAPGQAGATSVLTDYASGERGAALRPNRLQQQVASFLRDFGAIVPGAAAAATRDARGDVRAFLEHWPSNPLTRGSYTCYRPGQFTGIAGLEAQAAGALKFAGEHTDSFYSWQGFLEGACLSGLRAADEVVSDVRAR
jgi:monoamine oxidase